jgi:hypothetical protein
MDGRHHPLLEFEQYSWIAHFSGVKTPGRKRMRLPVLI